VRDELLLDQVTHTGATITCHFNVGLVV